MAGQEEARLALKEATLVRGGRTLFAGLSLALGAGEAALVTGPNGAGKSSLVRLVAGLLAPAEGRVERTGRVALMTEAAALDPDRPLRGALRFWAGLDGSDGAKVEGAMAATGLAALADAPVRLLSTGQRRRAAFARILIGNVPIWLLDEPANGLDALSVIMLEGLLAEHRAAGGIALVATHQPIALPAAKMVAL